MDRLPDSLFSMHMVQHILLIEVAAPLIVLSRPWNRLWRPLPALDTAGRGRRRRTWRVGRAATLRRTLLVRPGRRVRR